MTIQLDFPIGCKVINLGQFSAKVVGYKDDNVLILEGIDHERNTGKWIADPQKTVRVSNWHLCFSGKYEYFFIENRLYRALATNYIDNNGNRSGARYQMRQDLITSEYLSSLGI